MSAMFPHIFIPPIFLRPSIEHRFANLLISDPVQQISFRFGHVHVLPAHFRAVADALKDGTLSVTFNPTALAAEGSLAEYDSGSDTFTFQGDTVLDTATGGPRQSTRQATPLRTFGSATRQSATRKAPLIFVRRGIS